MEGVILLAWTPSSICIIFHIVQWLLQSRTKLLEKGFPIMSTFLRNKNISKTMTLRKENPFPQFNVASYKRPGIRLPFEYTTTLLSAEGGEERTGTATMLRKMLPKYAIFSTVLSKIAVTTLFPSTPLACWLFWKQMWPVLGSSTLSGHPVLGPNSPPLQRIVVEYLLIHDIF